MSALGSAAIRRCRTLARVTAAVVVAASAALAGCTKAQLAGESSAYAVLDQLSAASGGRANEFSGSLASDVLTLVKKTVDNQQVCTPTVYQDPGRATMRLQLKDPGTAAAPAFPSPANTITFTRYHVRYIRADGRNQQGVDVPYEFDGGLTTSLAGGNAATAQLIVVRAQAKEEAPLKALIGGGGAVWIATIAEIAFYGADQAGRPVSVKGNIDVSFADWGDPEC